MKLRYQIPFGIIGLVIKSVQCSKRVSQYSDKHMYVLGNTVANHYTRK